MKKSGKIEIVRRKFCCIGRSKTSGQLLHLGIFFHPISLVSLRSLKSRTSNFNPFFDTRKKNISEN